MPPKIRRLISGHFGERKSYFCKPAPCRKAWVCVRLGTEENPRIIKRDKAVKLILHLTQGRTVEQGGNRALHEALFQMSTSGVGRGGARHIIHPPRHPHYPPQCVGTQFPSSTMCARYEHNDKLQSNTPGRLETMSIKSSRRGLPYPYIPMAWDKTHTASP